MLEANPWPPDKISRFTQMWNDKDVPFRDIMKEMGKSRSAISGKARRLKLEFRAGPTGGFRELAMNRGAIAARLRRAKKGADNLVHIHVTRQKRLLAAHTASESDKQIPHSQRKQLIELESCHCHWPVGDVGEPGFFFCGGEALPEKPYCATHCNTAYRQE